MVINMWYAVVAETPAGNLFVKDFKNKQQAEKYASELNAKHSETYKVVKHFFEHK